MESSVMVRQQNFHSQNRNQEDRISDLPDAILCRILSEVPTKYAFGTSFLATRWKNIFPQIPNPQIIIDDSDLNNPDTPLDHRKASFTRFIYNLKTFTLRQVEHIQKFVLCLEQEYENDLINGLLLAVLQRNLSILSVTFPVSHEGLSCDSLFLSETLKEICLRNLNFLNILTESRLPKLKNMMLINVTFFKCGLLERAISACPLLDSLIIKNCRIKELVRFLTIESASVKKLTLVNISDCCDDGSTYDVVLDMPALEFIFVVDSLPEKYHVKNFNRVRFACLHIGPSTKQLEEYDILEMQPKFQNVNVLVEACSRVYSLFLSRVTVMALGSSFSPLPTFPHLTKLELCGIDSLGWELLPAFLDSSPNLEVLAFRLGFSEWEGCYAEFQSNVPEHVPRCLNLHLHNIIFEAFKGEEDELQLVEYFLKCTQSLAKIEFFFSSFLSLEVIRCTKTKLWSLRNLSKKSEVDFTFKIEDDCGNLS